MKPIPLEDTAADIIGKAQRGLRISDSQLAQKSGASAEDIRRLRDGDFDEETVRRVGPVLQLDADSIMQLVRGTWEPEAIGEMNGLAQFNTEFGEMTVNAYLVWNPKTREAIAFDTGADSSEMLRRVAIDDLSVMLILLTHSHPDHIADLSRLSSGTGAPIFISTLEPLRDVQTISEGEVWNVGSLRIEALLTSGHSAGGITYVVRGLARPIAIVGDSLFAGSMGGGAVSYEDAVRNNVEKILSLPDETIVCPGHGPLTTVGKEKRDNPFFAAKFRK
ncbi:MAG: MBL fold metallo-hydrolase [Chthoniobacterales bacterium]|nr:MBL fold metallo-hydrolase [Chthoniobacterales bacterium]